ncbi:MAG TPA: C39 family peptidase, partial [Pyrinomonadaceae bacterium]|nr:C39 family peptidase [Pyrinomonadaceae bacterium]
MPVTVNEGTPIPTNTVVGGSLADLLEGGRLKVNRDPQDQDAWCYAACASMVINFLIATNDFVPQCQVASFVKRTVVQSCCDPTPDACKTSGCTADQVGEIFRNFKIDYEGSDDPTNIFGTITPSEIRDEIHTDGRPIEVVIDWADDGFEKSSHALLITGFREADEYVYITDPLNGLNYNGWQPYEFLDEGFGQGKWARTWTG